MSTQANKANNRRFYEEIWNGGKLAVVDELVAANTALHNPTITVYGPEGFKQYVAMHQTAFPDIHFTIEDEIAEGGEGRDSLDCSRHPPEFPHGHPTDRPSG